MKAIIKNLKMNRIIMLLPFIFTVFKIIIASISYQGMSNQKSALDNVFNVRFQTYQDASQLITQIMTINKGVYRLLGFANSGMDAGKIEAMGKDLLKAMGDAKALANHTLAKPLDTKEKVLL